MNRTVPRDTTTRRDKTQTRWIDLHLHSTASDGGYPPSRLVEMAHARGLSAVALTDHDTVAGCEEAAARAAQLGVEFIPGIELEAAHPRGALHILGYFVDTACTALADLSAAAVQRRAERNREILERLRVLGVNLPQDVIEPDVPRHAIGRPHIAHALVRAGHVRDFRTAFNDYLADGAPAFVPFMLPAAEAVIAAIRSAGGLASLAHPVRLRYGSSLELRTLVKRLRDAGLAAIETIHPSHLPVQTREYHRLAEELGLAATGGSDFHRLPPKQEHGVGFGRVRVPYDLLESLRRART
ncbi:MAG: PHP domain-containing protein [Phycisphaerae bacterium]|nr:PHP domain-containing protein [Phycisphaerae bacterium]